MPEMRLVHPITRSRRGFTLIEVLIVVVVVGILLGTALPGLGRSVTQDRVRRAGTIVQGMVDEAARLAQRRGAPVTITISGNWLRVTDRNSGAVIKQRSFGPGQDINASLAIRPTTGITVFPNGRGTALLQISLSGGGESVVVSRTTTGILRRN